MASSPSEVHGSALSLLTLKSIFTQNISLRFVAFLLKLSRFNLRKMHLECEVHSIEELLNFEDSANSILSSPPIDEHSPHFRRMHAKAMIRRFKSVLGQDRSYRAHSFKNDRGQSIFTHSWLPEPLSSMKAIVIIIHGLNEHSGRYENFGRLLNDQGYGAFGMDWLGHGCSDGLHGYVESLDDVVSDVKLFVKMVSADYPSTPIFLFGHSTGGAVALKAAGMDDLSGAVHGLILTSPAVHVQASSRLLAALAPIASVLIPTFQMPNAVKNGIKVTRDLKALEDKYNDPLVYTGGVRARTGFEVLSITNCLKKTLHLIQTPFFVLHGSDDQLTDPFGSRLLYDKATSRHKKIRLYEGLLHDLLFEPEKESIAQDIIHWMDNRLSNHDHEDAP